MQCLVAIFGEAEKGAFRRPCFCPCLAKLMDTFGNPPEDGEGLSLAIQTLLFEHQVIFFRVKEEGFATEDYLSGFSHLEKIYKDIKIDALGIPKVGDAKIFEKTKKLCSLHKCFLLCTEKDLYDFVTSR